MKVTDSSHVAILAPLIFKWLEMARLGARGLPSMPLGLFCCPSYWTEWSPKLAEMSACNADSPLLNWDPGKMGDKAFSLVNFHQGLLLKLPPPSATMCLLPSLQGRSRS